MIAPPVRALSFHAAYACRHSGRCCTSGWPIDVEPAQLQRWRAAGLLTPRTAARRPLVLEHVEGRCVFHDGDAAGGCTIHRALGHGALPLACRQFPRISLRDPRGVSVTLSHYCPTANDLIHHVQGPIAVRIDAAAFPSGAEYVGLTTDPDLPPLLHPALAMDWESWWAFEELAVECLDTAQAPLERLALVVEDVRAWTVDAGPLQARVRDAFDRARRAPAPSSRTAPANVAASCTHAIVAVPDAWRSTAAAALAEASPASVPDRVTRRYLAAHAFANWAAYQGTGLRTWFRSLEAAAHLLARTADPGSADLVLRHLADSNALIEGWDASEAAPVV